MILFGLQFRWRKVSALVACAAGALSSSCVVLHEVNPDPQPALTEADAEEGERGEGFRYAPRGARGNPDPWWESFRDRELNREIEDSLAENPDLRSVAGRIDQANARVIQAGSTLFPQIDGAGEFRRRWRGDGVRDDSSEIGVLLGWELDVWNRIRSGRAARIREAEAAYEDWRAARLLLTGAVGETWYVLVEQRGQRRLAEEQIELNQTLLDLTRLRAGQGQSSMVDVLQQKEQLESTESRVPLIESQIAEVSLVLEALGGRVPGKRDPLAGTDQLPDPPPWPRTGVPADLLAERPDLRARRARILAVDHEVGEAIADRFPRFSIGGSLAGAGSAGLEALVGDAVVGAVGPVFDAGARRAEVDRRRSRVQEELDLYTSEFIDAVREVETALVREQKLDERVTRQTAQLGTARKLLAESRSRYTLGASDYLPVLDAVSKVQELERDVLTTRRERLSARILLHRALGGPVPEPDPVNPSAAP